MKKVGINVNQKTAQIIRFGGFILPVVLTFYGLLIQLKVVSSEHYVNDLVFFSIVITWVMAGVYQFLYPTTNKTNSAIRIVLYHILAILYIFFVSGFSMPFIVTWVILFLAAYAYFGQDGFRLSILTFVVVAISDVILNIGTQNYLLMNTVNLLATLLVGVVAVTISEAQEVDKVELVKTRAEGMLQHDRIMTIVNNLADAVLSTDKNGNIQIYNAATLGLFDTNVSLEGKNIDSVVKFLDARKRKFTLTDDMKSAKGVVSRTDLSTIVADENMRLSVVYTRIRGTDSTREDLKNNGYVIIMRDITKEKSLEEERDEFISVVSHELRTPITIAEGTLGNTAVMLGREDIPRANLANNVKLAHDQVLFLAKMVNDLSTLSRAERGTADTVELINVQELAGKVYNEYTKQASEKGLAFNLDLDTNLENVQASRLYLEELLQNFVTNAIKYTKEGGITLSVKHAPNDHLEFSVKDTGIGISKADQAKIFEKFYRSEDYRTRETGGTGLGLYVATKLARKLDTHIKMSSRLNHGSTFSIELPKVSVHRS